MALLEVNQLKKSFGSLNVLKGISFCLERGEVLAIIGSSGSGKTTLLRCLNFLETADSGTITVNGETLFNGANKSAVKDEDLRIKRLHFGLVFQQFNLFPHFNVLKNVTLAPSLLIRSRIRGAAKASLKANKNVLERLKNEPKILAGAKKEFDKEMSGLEGNAKSIIERVGLGDKLKSYPCELSGGQQQRVAIARALILNPDILCFDEPTSALDPELTGEVLKVIRGLKDSDRTMIVVTHEMEFARNVADKVIFMSNGVIEEEGTPEEVFGNPNSEKTKSFLAKYNESNL